VIRMSHYSAGSRLDSSNTDLLVTVEGVAFTVATGAVDVFLPDSFIPFKQYRLGDSIQ
jgi:hypothetical protein